MFQTRFTTMAFTRTSALEYLRRAHERGRLAHAYLISGPPGSGKRGLASDLSALVTGSKSNDVFAAQPPGVFLAEPESKSRRIVIDQVRELEHALQMRAVGGHRKVAILVEADRLQSQAAHAFLKTLEEPPNDSLLLLLSSMPEVLPDTILSRCITLPLLVTDKSAPSAGEKELLELLGAIDPAETENVRCAYRITRGFQGLLGLMKESIQEENAAALKQEEARYKNTTDGAWLDEREDYFKALSESQYIQKRACLIDLLVLWWTDVLRVSTGVERRELPSARETTRLLGEKLSTPEILRRLWRLEELRKHLGRNIQEALAIEVAFLSIFTF